MLAVLSCTPNILQCTTSRAGNALINLTRSAASQQLRPQFIYYEIIQWKICQSWLYN